MGAMRIAMRVLARPLGLAVLLTACGEGRPPPAPYGVDGGPPPACEDAPSSIVCIADVAVTCDGEGNETTRQDCSATGETCARGVGCRTCVPNTVSCEGETVRVCTTDGTGFTLGETCDASAGLHCSPGGCRDLCADAAASRSYIGCEYWPVTTRNSQLAPEFVPAVVVANASLVPATVRISRGGSEIVTRTVAPEGLETIELDWVEALRAPADGGSVLARDGAYRLVSDVPVTVYQFNPLEFRIDRDCAVEAPMMEGDGQCFSFTNDASLLLPSHVLTGSYVVATRATQLVRVMDAMVATPGFVAIVGVSDTPTTVEVETRANVLPSGDGAVSGMTPGQTQTFTLGAGDVVELASDAPPDGCPTEWVAETRADMAYCALGQAWDLTGTEIRADGPVAIIAGHDCTFVPFDRWACDHLEEALFPVETWGREVVIGRTRPLRGEPNIVRVVSSADANTIRFEPAVTPPVTLGRGDHVELELDRDVTIRGDGPFVAAQLLVGQDYAGLGTSGPRGSGDPSMALAIPTEQYRSSYVFLAPATYDESFVNVIAPGGAQIVIDGALVSGFEPIEGSTMQRARTPIGGGAHRIEGTAPFGILVYGFGSYTSYMYPGGLDLREIAPPI
jgi:hypothetical protein